MLSIQNPNRNTEINPTMKLNASNAVKLVVVARPIDNTAPKIHNSRIKGLLLTISPNGDISSRAPAYPACVRDGIFDISSYGTPKLSDR
jgi:hypothetical protein